MLNVVLAVLLIQPNKRPLIINCRGNLQSGSQRAHTAQLLGCNKCEWMNHPYAEQPHAFEVLR